MNERDRNANGGDYFVEERGRAGDGPSASSRATNRSAPPAQMRGKWAWVSLGGALVATAAAMGVCVAGQYTLWDTKDFLDRSPFGRQGVIESLWSILNGDSYSDTADYVVFQASGFFDIVLFRRNPHLSHLLNLALHLVNVALVWHCIRLLLARSLSTRLSNGQIVLAAGIGAALFGIHPVNVEAVALVTSRKVELALLFSLSAFVLLLSPRGGWARYVLAVLSYTLALFSNAAAFGLALVFGAWWTMVERVRFRRALLLALPFLALVVWAAAMRTLTDTPENDLISGKESRSGQIGACFAGRARETLNLVWPKGLAPIYHSVGGPVWTPDSFVGILLMTLSALLIVWGWRRGASGPPRSRRVDTVDEVDGADRDSEQSSVSSDQCVQFTDDGPLPAAHCSLPAAHCPLPTVLAFGLAWYWLALAPNFAHHHTQLDRHMYCSAIGLFMGVGVLLALAFARLRTPGKTTLAAVCGVAALALGIAAARQAALWRTDKALFEHTVAVTKNNRQAHFFLGLALADEKDFDGAILQYRAALALDPGAVDTRNKLAAALLEKGNTQEAFANLRLSMKLAPKESRAPYLLALALRKLGRPDEAETLLRHAIGLEPEYPEAHQALGLVLRDQRKFEEAAAELTKAIELKPDFAEAEVNLGITLGDLGRWDETVSHCEAALRIDPDFAEAEYNIAVALARTDRPLDAIAHYEAALRLRPEYAEAETGIGNALLELGRAAESIGHYERALRLRPDSAEAENGLGNAFFLTDRPQEALAHYEAALRIRPGYVTAEFNLANLLAQMGRVEEAVAHYEAVLRVEPDYAAARSALDEISPAPRETEP